MTLKIGSKIKALRKRADITQDTLSEYLGVTAQAISRWESEICYPDIEILPAIADYFGISLDELVGMDQKQKECRINQYIEEANREQCAGNFAKAVAVYREAVRHYPSSYRLQANLASAIGCMDNGEKISVELAEEAIDICNRILDVCVDEEIRQHSLNILCWIYYRQLGDEVKAMDIVAKLPKVYGCREFVMAETMQVRMPDEKAKEIVFAFVSALLIAFNKQEFAYSNNNKVMLDMLIGELNGLMQGLDK